MKKEILTLIPFTKSRPHGYSKGERNFGELDPSATIHPQMEAPSSHGGESGGDTPGSRAQSPERPLQSSVRVIFMDSPSSSRQSTPSSDDSNFSSIFQLLNLSPPSLLQHLHHGDRSLIFLQFHPLRVFFKIPNTHPLFHLCHLPLQLFKTLKIL